MAKPKIKNKKICIAGLQGPGIALIEVLKKAGAEVTGAQSLDQGKQDRLFEQISSEGVHWIFSDAQAQSLLEQDYIICTPGYLSLEDRITAAEQAGIPIYSELDFVSQFVGATVVGITGTNGKSTTASILLNLLEAAGISAMVVEGGKNPLGLALGKKCQVLIFELNSLRLQKSKSFHPKISIITNLAPAHMERHSTLSEYYQAKAKIYAHQGPEEFLIYNGLSEAMKRVLEDRPCRAKKSPLIMPRKKSLGCFAKKTN